MRRLIVYSTLLISCFVFIRPAYAKSPLDSVKIVVADYFDDLYGDSTTHFEPNHLNFRFEIYDILTKEKVRDDIKNGRIYFCTIMGDDSCGVYLLLDQNTPKIIRIQNISEFKTVWDFMRRNGYTLEQIDRAVDYITSNYEYEKSITVH